MPSTTIDVIKTFPLLSPIDDDHPNARHIANYLKRAYATAQKSNDPSTHVGAVLIPSDSHMASQNPIIYGYNEIIGLGQHSERADRPAKYEYVVHAEERTIAHAARYGKRTERGFMFAPWFACMDCAKHIGEAGIRQVVGHITPFAHTPESWIETIQKAHRMLVDDYGVELYVYMGEIGITNKISGETISV